MQEDARKTEALCHSARKACHECFSLVPKLHKFKNFLANVPTLWATYTISGRKEFQVLNHFHVVVHAEKVWHVADHAADFLWPRVDRMTTDIRLAPGWV